LQSGGMRNLRVDLRADARATLTLAVWFADRIQSASQHESLSKLRHHAQRASRQLQRVLAAPEGRHSFGSRLDLHPDIRARGRPGGIATLGSPVVITSSGQEDSRRFLYADRPERSVQVCAGKFFRSKFA